ncbi:MAG: acyl-CoA thioesterase [Gammaproteobacteria bacterium]|nr:acyl-CoA thioesterase [Gammaproteobacteria bacterium]MCF6362464.1 acyl-CoA thioesterase [Gammaproteobacteria bacterium]
MLSTETEIIIPFHDVDPMQVVWHGRYVKYFETARCQLLESFDYGYEQMFESGYAWPVVDMRIKYVKPLRFNQRVVVESQLVEWEYRLKIKYRIRDADSGETLSKGYTIQVAVDMETQEMCLESPPALKKKLGET